MRRGKVKLNPSALYLAVASLFSASKPRGSTDRAATDALPETDYQQENGGTVAEVAAMWGGRLPSWREFRRAVRDKRVRVDPTVAVEAVHWKGMPPGTRMLYGIVTNWAAFLLLPALFILHQFGRSVTDWDAVLGLLGTWLLFRVTLRGSCEAIRQAAEEDARLYHALVEYGAFHITPPPVFRSPAFWLERPF